MLSNKKESTICTCWKKKKEKQGEGEEEEKQLTEFVQVTDDGVAGDKRRLSEAIQEKYSAVLIGSLDMRGKVKRDCKGES